MESKAGMDGGGGDFSFFLFFYFLENLNSLMTFVFLGYKQTRLPLVLLGPGIQCRDGGAQD